MEELSIQEKSERYNKAIEEARKIYNQTEFNYEKIKCAIEQIFPELKSDDEDKKIREALIDFFSISAKRGEQTNGVYDKDILAWLENQGEQKPIDKVEPKFKVGDAIRHIPNDINMSQEEYKITRIDDKFYYSELKDGTEIILFGFPAQDTWELLEQNPTNNVEPKFKIGDFVVDNCGYVWKIEGIINQFYILEGIDGSESRPTIDWVNETFHHWTIQDARDGDVLAAHECLVLFREIDGLNIRCYCTYHFMNNPSFYVNTLQNKDAFHPATKEQRDQLEKAMTNAGWEFDFDKKELKKIEQKFNIGDEIKTANEEPLTITKIDEKGYWSEDLFICGFDDTAKWEVVGQKTAWSEEDKRCEGCNNAKGCVACVDGSEWAHIEELEKQGEQNHCMIQWKGDNLKEVIDFTGKDKNFEKWFKSFEEYEKYVQEHDGIFKLFNADGSHYEVPVGAWIVKTPDGYNVASKAVFKQKSVDTPKFKVEQTSTWSEDDKDLMYNTLSNLTELKDRYGEGYGKVGKCIDWLKSLKERVQPQNTWKPSGEQILALRWILNNIPYNRHKEEISGLLEQLKKLKE